MGLLQFLANVGDQAVESGDVFGHLGALFRQRRLNAAGQDLAQLHAPLVEGIDPPDDAFHEDHVLVQDQQPAEVRRRQAVQKHYDGGPVARHHAMRQQRFELRFRDALVSHQRACLFRGSPHCQRGRLRQHVRKKLPLGLAVRVVRLDDADGVAGQLGITLLGAVQLFRQRAQAQRDTLDAAVQTFFG